MLAMEELLQMLVSRKGSDLHISAGSPPKARVNGTLVDLTDEKLMPKDTQRLLYSVLDSDQIAKFEKELELDLSFGIQGLGRFRTNVFRQRGAIGGVLRLIPFDIIGFEELGLPVPLCQWLCHLPKGLILVTGATGSGKSSTLAAMMDYINTTLCSHIITIEDPIEFIHRNKQCLINQREVGSDTRGFKESLRTILRQDPDIVLIGEMRDQETVEAALTISETGHLTFATLHTSDSVQTINRIIDIFPAYQQQQVRTMLSFTLQAVFCQQLIPKADGHSRALACEIMVATSAVRALIRDDKAHQIYSIIQTGGKFGMKTMNQSLVELVTRGIITREEAFNRSTDPDDLGRSFEKRGMAVSSSNTRRITV
jgi:twitching motility protein PilT